MSAYEDVRNGKFMNLQLFGVMEDESVDSVQEVLRNYPGMEAPDVLQIAIFTELRRLNDSLSCLEVQISGIGRLAECINEHGQFYITGTVTNYEE